MEVKNGSSIGPLQKNANTHLGEGIPLLLTVDLIWLLGQFNSLMVMVMDCNI